MNNNEENKKKTIHHQNTNTKWKDRIIIINYYNN